MSVPVCGLRSQVAAARPESKRQVGFATETHGSEGSPPSRVHSSDSDLNDDVAAGACNGQSSRARRDAMEHMSSGGSYPVQVKNTFIELLEEGEEEDPMSLSLWPRSKTVPTGTVACDHRRGLSDASTIASSDEDGRAPTADDPACGGSEVRRDCFGSGGGHSVQVKNTFIELEDVGEEEDPISLSLWPRSKTVPHGELSRDLLGTSEEGADASSDGEGGAAPTGYEAAGERLRCGSSEGLLERFNGVGSVSVQVKNTFIELEEDDEEEDPMSLVSRSKTAPSGALGCDSLLNRDGAGSDMSSDEDGGGPTFGESVGGRVHCGSSGELVSRFNSVGSVSVQVKNTFIELEEDGEEEDPMSLVPRSKTVPNGALSCGILPSRDGAGSESCGEDGGVQGVDEPAAGLAAQQATLFCSTPTPRWEAALPTLWPAAAVHSGAGLAFGHAPDTAEGPRRQEREEGPASAARSAEAVTRSEGGGPKDPKTTGGSRSLQQQTLQSSEVDGFSRAQWTVDGRKLRGSDKRLVSPSFDLDLGLGAGPVAFVLVLYPKSATFKGSSSFKEAGGLGHVQLKCVSELDGDAAAVKVRLSVGRGRARQLRGPFVHSFAASPLLALPKAQAEWDFGAAVEGQPASLFVSVDVALA